MFKIRAPKLLNNLPTRIRINKVFKTFSKETKPDLIGTVHEQLSQCLKYLNINIAILSQPL